MKVAAREAAVAQLNSTLVAGASATGAALSALKLEVGFAQVPNMDAGGVFVAFPG